MGGRERRRSRVRRRRDRDRWSLTVAGAPEEPSARSRRRASRGRDRGPEKTILKGGTSGHVHQVFCSVERPWRSRSRRERGFIWGLIRRPGTAATGGGNPRSCTLVFLFTDDGPGGAVVAVGGEGLGLNESIREPPVVEETE